MNKQHKKFLKKFKKYLKSAPDLRITQALFNLGVTLGIKKGSDTKPEYYFIDNYNETDNVILARMNKSLRNGKTQKKEKREQKQMGSSGGETDKQTTN